jgi:mRNA-degrading endonuclease RelE of RelBE toxin-antitoxin system
MRGHKGDVARLRHMLDFARKAVNFSRGRTRADFDDDAVGEDLYRLRVGGYRIISVRVGHRKEIYLPWRVFSF